jgi:hypothetical protein
MSFLLSSVFPLQQNQRTKRVKEVLPERGGGVVEVGAEEKWGGGPNNVYTYK